MIVKRLEDVVGTKGDAHGDKWHSLRLLHKEDGMGVTLTDSILEAGFQMDLWQKNHLGVLEDGADNLDPGIRDFFGLFCWVSFAAATFWVRVNFCHDHGPLALGPRNVR